MHIMKSYQNTHNYMNETLNSDWWILKSMILIKQGDDYMKLPWIKVLFQQLKNIQTSENTMLILPDGSGPDSSNLPWAPDRGLLFFFLNTLPWCLCFLQQQYRRSMASIAMTTTTPTITPTITPKDMMISSEMLPVSM